MLTFGFIHGDSGFDPLILLLVALMLDGYFGDAPLLYRYLKHPVAVVGDLIGLLDRKLNRETRSDANRAVRGALVVVVVAGFAGGVGAGVAWLGQTHPWGWPFELLLVTSLLAGRSLYEGLGWVIPTPQGMAYHAFWPQSIVYATGAQEKNRLEGNGFAQYCSWTQEGVRWRVNRGQLDRVWFGKPGRETFVMDYHPFTLPPQETWQTTLSVVYQPKFAAAEGW